MLMKLGASYISKGKLSLLPRRELGSSGIIIEEDGLEIYAPEFQKGSGRTTHDEKYVNAYVTQVERNAIDVVTKEENGLYLVCS